jgi:uncharacterized protein (TIGR03067 family)
MWATKRCGLLVIVAAFSLGAGPEAVDTATSRADEVIGTWSIVSYERDGQSAPPEVFRDVSVKFETHSLEFRPYIGFNEKTGRFFRGDQPGMKSWYYLTSRPRLGYIDLKSDGCEEDEPYQEGIYLLDGNTLKICYADYKTPCLRPDAFRTRPGSHRWLLVLKRQRP